MAEVHVPENFSHISVSLFTGNKEKGSGQKHLKHNWLELETKQKI